MTNQKKKHQSQQSIKNLIDKKYYVIAGAVLVVLIILFVFPGILTQEHNKDEYYMFSKEGELIISDSTGIQKVKIDIEIADTDYDRQLGLMKRVSMEEKQGMLFIFSEEKPQSFWMRNTLISLDMIFISSNRKIVTIHKNTKVLSDQSYPSSSPAQYVLEVNTGFSDKYKVIVGDLIRW